MILLLKALLYLYKVTFPNPDHQLDIYSIYKRQLLWTGKNYKISNFSGLYYS